MISHRGRRS